MTAGGTGWDKTILAPATQYVYTRLNANEITINNTAPSNTGNNITWDTSLPVVHVQIADGSGGDCTQGIGYEYLSDTYSWGNVLSDYQIVAPYADTTVTVSYWANSQWNVGEVHSLNGTQTNPDAVDRDGTNGFGVDGTNISGLAANLASGANLWKWESTKPIALIINDTADDEERLLGWMSNKTLRTSSNVTQSFVNLIDKDDRSRMKIYGKDLTTTVEYAGAKLSGADYIEFDGTDDTVNFEYDLRSNWTYECWVNKDSKDNFSFLGQGVASARNGLHITMYSNRLRFGMYANDTDAVGLYSNTSTGVWYHYAFSYNHSTYVKKIYRNGLPLSVTPQQTQTAYEGTGIVRIGALYSSGGTYANGKISNSKLYNRVLTDAEIQQNFNSIRGRFGI
jgi:hypothetical protein